MVKFTVAFGVAALKCATASFATMNQLISNSSSAASGPQGRSGNRGGQDDRNLLHSPSLTELDDYGCWCFFSDNELGSLSKGRPGPGRGKPVDPVDELCRNLHQAYDCVIMDIEAEGGWTDHHKIVKSQDSAHATFDDTMTEAERMAYAHEDECVPWTVEYIPITHVKENKELGLYKGCQSLNEPNVFQERTNEPFTGIGAATNSQLSPGRGRCGTLACAIEGHFVENILLLQQLYLSQIPVYGHAEGFEHDTLCQVSDGHNQAPEPECCGNYPIRYKYSPENKWGTRSCCGQDIFDSSLFECCDEATSAFDTTCPTN